MAYKPNYNSLLKEMLTEKGTVSACYSAFHNFSIHNQFLAWIQLKEKGLPVSPIACKSKWLERGNRIQRKYYGNKGAIWLCMPMSYKYTEKDENGKEVVKYAHYFKYLPNWYAACQLEKEEKLDDEQEKLNLNFNLDKVVEKHKIKKIEYDSVDGNCQGYCYPKEKTFAINPIAESPFKTSLHEIAHILLKHGDDNDPRSIHELEAEASAYIVMSVLGAEEDTLEKMRGYIQGWFKENEVPEKSATKIMGVANDILKTGLGK